MRRPNSAIILDKTDNLRSDEPGEVPSVTIDISGKIPDFSKISSLEEAEKYYDAQAEKLSAILVSSLPQGTLDRLLLHLMKRKLSFYRGLTES